MADAAVARKLVEVEGLKMHFPVVAGLLRRRVGAVRAVDGVSFSIAAGETLGLVGESGCGKSTVGRSLLRLCQPTAGRVRIDGEDVLTLGPAALRAKRPAMQMVFQDPQASLNPRMTLSAIISEPLNVHTGWPAERKASRVRELMDAVGLDRRFVNRYPHEFSGGQRQRVGIARALALNPKFIVCDEPIAALDVSIQAQVVNLLERLQRDFGLTYLFISHDLSMVRHIADRVAVMYLGRIAELSPRDALFARPLHPYAEALLSALPRVDRAGGGARTGPRPGGRIILKGDVPSPARMPPGCNFHTRCPRVFDRCRTEAPELGEAEPGRLVACHLFPPGKPAAGQTGEISKNTTHQQGDQR